MNTTSLATSFFHHGLPCFPDPQWARVLTLIQALANPLSLGTRPFSYGWSATMDLIRFY